MLRGGNGDDTMNGDGGNDKLVPALGDDTLNGGAGTDEIIYSGAVRYVVNLSTGVASGNGTNDTLTAIEDVITGGGADTITGDDNANTLRAGSGDDVVRGGDGDDFLFGNTGDDDLNGNGGTDTVSGGPDTDTCVGEILTLCEITP